MRVYFVGDKPYFRELTCENVIGLAKDYKSVYNRKLLCIGSKQFLNDKELRRTKTKYPINYGRKIGDKFIWIFMI